MDDLIGWAWQKLECERLGLTVEEHNQLVEAVAQVAAAGDGSVIDAYRSAVSIMENNKSAAEAANFLENN